MTISTRPVAYQHDGKSYEGVLALDGSLDGPRPLVLVCHAWAGLTDYETNAARRIADLGYAAFAADLYGKGVVGASAEENHALMTPFVEDRAMLQARLHHALDVAKAQPEVEADRAAAMGFCFGGLCVLDLARSGGDVAGVASFHGLLGAPGNTTGKPIASRVIAFHGWADPMATPDDVLAFSKEMDAAGADWQLHAYGGVMHAFTNPQANDPDFGTVYDARANERAWLAFEDFLSECFDG